MEIRQWNLRQMKEGHFKFHVWCWQHLFVVVDIAVIKMAFTVQQKVQCCYWLAEFKYPKIVERRFRQQWPEKQPPDRHTITTWHRKLLEIGSLVEKSPRGKKVTEAQVDKIQHALQRSPSKSLRRASRELAIPRCSSQEVMSSCIQDSIGSKVGTKQLACTIWVR